MASRTCRFNGFHLTGAMAAMAATILLKPRIGKFNKDGSPNELAGHNQVFTALGVLLLWVGWFGFNAGSTFGVDDAFFGFVALNTQIAAAGGAVAALLIAWAIIGKPDVPTMLNGALAGLVAITASCAFVDPWAAVVIGIIGGLIVFGSMKLVEKLGIDDRSSLSPFTAQQVSGVPFLQDSLQRRRCRNERRTCRIVLRRRLYPAWCSGNQRSCMRNLRVCCSLCTASYYKRNHGRPQSF